MGNNKKIKLCFDARMFRHSGIGVYIRNMVNQLKEDVDFDTTFLVPETGIDLFDSTPQKLFNASIYSIKEQLYYPIVIPTCDVFWSPHYNVPLLPTRSRKKAVTIHDAYHLRFANELSFLKKQYARICFKKASQSDQIFTVSKFSKKEIESYFPTSAERIHVVYNGVDQSRFAKKQSEEKSNSVLAKYNLTSPYLLFVGNVKPHKNLITLVKAFELVLPNYQDIHLCIVGKKNGFITSDNEVSHYLTSKESLSHKVIFTGHVEDDDLPIIYQHAKLFVFPSLYEGFGLPPLEALAAGIPVICSNAGPMKEVCGENVSYFNPNSEKELAHLISEKLSKNGHNPFTFKLPDWELSYTEHKKKLIAMLD